MWVQRANHITPPVLLVVADHNIVWDFTLLHIKLLVSSH